MLKKTQSFGRLYTAAPRWAIGMAGGVCLAIAGGVLTRASFPAILATIIVFGVVGAVAGSWQKKPVIQQAPVRDKHIRSHVFQALEVTTKKLKNIVVDEDFNGVSGGGGEKDRRSMKTASPKLHVPPPSPPKMGGNY